MIAVRHAGVVVSDLQRALRFYCGTLGFQVVREMDEHGEFIDAILGIKDARLRTVKLQGAGTAQLELLEFREPAAQPADGRPLNRVGPTHVALQVDAIDALHARLAAEGTPFTTAPRLSPDGRARVTFCRDPDGTWLELVELVAA